MSLSSFIAPWRRCASGLLLLVAPASRLAAQEVRDTATLPDIVVTATRYPVSADSVAATVTVLRGEDLRAQGIRSVAEALRQVPGVQVVQGGSYGATASVFVRGGESDYVKVLLDGIPLNQPGGSYDFAALTTDNVERIEILRGPGSVLYGSDAIAGVIQIVTREGRAGAELAAGAEGGSFGTAKWQVGGLGGGSGVGWSGELSRLTTDGTYAFNSGYHNTAASARLGAGVGERTHVAVAGRYTDATFHFPTDFTGAPVDRNQFNVEETFTLSGDATHRLSEAVEGQLLVGRNRVSSEFANPEDTPGAGGESHTVTDTERWTVDARAQVRGPVGVRGLAGVSFDNQHQESASSFGGFASPPFDAERDNWGFYLQASALPVRRLQVTAGGRLDQNERFGSFWTYRANALAFVSPGTRLRGSLGTGFREPAFFENFTTGFSTGNPDLEPERSFNLEGGVEQDLAGGRVGISLAAFAQRFRDLIQYTPFPPLPGDPNFFNVPAANASGLEATLRVRPLPVLEGSLAYTHVATKVTDAGFDTDEAATFVQGRRLLRRPSHAFTARAEYAGAGRVKLGARVHWVGSRDDIRFAPFPEPSRRVELPAYTRVDLSGNFAVLRPGSGWHPGLELTARVENLFDEEYEQAAGYPSPGIALFVGARTRVH